jgi:hypothetical protein
MALRKGHGNGTGSPRIEVLPPDEQLMPVPAPQAEPAAPVARAPDGKLIGSEAAKELGRRGGLARAAKKRWVTALGITELDETHKFKSYYTRAEQWVEQRLVELAGLAGGSVGAGPAQMVVAAGRSWSLAWYYYDLGLSTDNPRFLTDSSKVSNEAKQLDMAAYEMAVREAAARRELSNNNASIPIDVFSSEEDES